MSQHRVDIPEPFLCAVRTPVLPIETVLSLFDALEPFAFLRTALERDPSIRTALEAASPSLAAAARRWISGEEPKNKRLPLRVAAYLIRMASRATPFALFAGIGLVERGSESRLQRRNEQRVWLRPDMQSLATIVSRFESDPKNWSRLRVVANDMVLARGRRLVVNQPDRILRLLDRENAPRNAYKSVSVRTNPGVELVMALASSPVVVEDLISKAAADFNIEREPVEALVASMWEAGLLISALRPRPVDDCVEPLIDALTDVAPEYESAINDLRTALADVPRAFADVREGHLQGVQTATSALVGDDQGNAAGPHFQIDLIQEFEGAIGEKVLADAARLAEIGLHFATSSSLDDYRMRFYERFESAERLVPLLELVDPDLGIGEPPEPRSESPGAQDETRKSRLLEIAVQAAVEGKTTVFLSSDELEMLLPPLPTDLPRRFEIGFKVGASSAAAIDAGDYEIGFASVWGTQDAGKSIGRFALAMPARAREAMAHLSAIEGDEIDAELAFCPVSRRLANVAIRPRIFKHEIQIGIHSEDDSVERIALSDILVGISAGRFFLWSESLGRRIRVRETHLMNTPSFEAGAVRFLSLVHREQYRQPGFFNWGQTDRLPFFPRLQCGRIVLSRARWHLPSQLVRVDEEAQLMAWLDRWRVPEYVALTDADNRLLLKLRSPLGLALLRDRALSLKSPVLDLTEPFPSVSQHWVRSDGGAHDAEFLLTVEQKYEQLERRVSRRRIQRVHDEERMRPFSSDWTFANVFCGRNHEDVVLRDLVGPLVRDLRAAGEIDSWFFIRYSNPRNHLRIRFHRALTSEPALGAAIRAFTAAQRDGIVEDFSFETYKREIERYGGPASMELCERLFAFDSDRHIAQLVRLGASFDERIDRCIAAFGPILHAMYPTSATLRRWLEANRPSAKLTIADRAFLRSSIHRDGGAFEELPTDVRDVVERLRSHAAGTEATYGLESIAGALLHMSFNRAGVEAQAETQARSRLWHLESRFLHERKDAMNDLAGKQ